MKNLFDLYCVDVLVNDVKTVAKDVFSNDVFVSFDSSLKSVDDAIKRGASFLVVKSGKGYQIPYVKVKNINRELLTILDNIYDNAKRVSLIAVTGTDGKTTVAELIKELLGKDRCGYIAGDEIKGKYINTKCNSLINVETIYKYLDKFYNENLDFCSLEVASEEMLNKKFAGLTFKIGVLTNFTSDHLDIHKNLDNYLKCKRKVFNKIDKDGVAILNRDDLFYKKFRTSCKSKVLTYGKNKYSSLRILSFREENDKTIINYRYRKKNFVIESPLKGEFNVYNLTAAILVLLYLGYDNFSIRKKVYDIKLTKASCKLMDYKTDYKIYLDNAHTENAVKNVLTYLNLLKKRRIITVIDLVSVKENTKKKKIKSIIKSLSDETVYIKDDRKSSIKSALDMARKNDIVIIFNVDEKTLYRDIFILDEYFK